MIETAEAFVLRKIQYGEADYVISLFTREFGKIRALAKNAKRSQKRFGGRIEPFLRINIRLRTKPGGMRFIEDSEIIRAFPKLSENMELFVWGGVVMECADALVPEEEPSPEAFGLVADALLELDSGLSPRRSVLNFQLRMLALSGYEPRVDVCLGCGGGISDGFFDIPKGGVLCRNCGREGVNFHWRGGDSGEKGLLSNIKTLIKFTEYQTGAEFKTAKFLEDFI